jgi:hypothetical protein
MGETEFINALGALLAQCPPSIFLTPMEPVCQEDEGKPQTIAVVRRTAPGCGKCLAYVPYPHH